MTVVVDLGASDVILRSVSETCMGEFPQHAKERITHAIAGSSRWSQAAESPGPLSTTTIGLRA